MKKLSVLSVAALLALCLVLVGTGSASVISLQSLSNNVSIKNGTVTVPFPTAGDAYCSATNGCGNIPSGGGTDFQWTTGDFVLSSIFVIPNSTSVTGLTANWLFADFLGDGNTETWAVFINGVSVASATLPDDAFNGDILTVTGSVTFAGIAPVSGGYQVELVLQNTVPFGGGSVSWLDGGTTGLDFTTSSVPEPGTIVLLGSSLLGFAGIARRKLIG